MPSGAHGTGTYNTIGTGTGWSAMARIVREIDEQKIQNYKDDIDTILVFVRFQTLSTTLPLILVM